MNNSMSNKIRISRALKIYNQNEFNYYIKHFDVDSLIELFQLDPKALGLD